MSRIWQGSSPSITPLGGTVPTTTAGVSLWNGEPQTPIGQRKVYVIDSIFAYFSQSQGAASHLTIFIQINNGKQPTPATGTAITPIQSTYGEPYNVAPNLGNAKYVTGMTVPNDLWTPLTSLITPNTANQGMAIEAPVEGYAIYPGFLFSAHGTVSASPVASSLVLGIAWRELTEDVARGGSPYYT